MPSDPARRLRADARRSCSRPPAPGTVDVPKKVLCRDPLAPRSVKEFYTAITDHYWYELFMDDLPVWGFVGEYVSAETSAAEGGPSEEQVYIYTHKSFDINYNGNRVRRAPRLRSRPAPSPTPRHRTAPSLTSPPPPSATPADPGQPDVREPGPPGGGHQPGVHLQRQVAAVQHPLQPPL